MRNDSFDELEHIPSLRTEVRELDDFQQEASPAVRGRRRAAAGRGIGTGPLWALVGALGIALLALGWWSFQRISLMEQQLVATQESFARISEEAAGRIQDISGKVVATESSVTSGSEALKLQIRQLENRLAELARQQQAQEASLGEQGRQLEQFAGALQGQQTALGEQGTRLEARLNELAGGQAALKTLQADQEKLQGDQEKQQASLTSLGGAVSELQKRSDPMPAISRLEQDLLVLRSELDNRPPVAANTAEFDAFRAQMTRSLNALRSQVQTLQKQMNGSR